MVRKMVLCAIGGILLIRVFLYFWLPKQVVVLDNKQEGLRLIKGDQEIIVECKFNRGARLLIHFSMVDEEQVQRLRDLIEKLFPSSHNRIMRVLQEA